MPGFSVRQDPRDGRGVYGVVATEFLTPGFSHVAGNADAEFIIFDMEHGLRRHATQRQLEANSTSPYFQEQLALVETAFLARG